MPVKPQLVPSSMLYPPSIITPLALCEQLDVGSRTWFLRFPAKMEFLTVDGAVDGTSQRRRSRCLVMVLCTDRKRTTSSSLIPRHGIGIVSRGRCCSMTVRVPWLRTAPPSTAPLLETVHRVERHRSEVLDPSAGARTMPLPRPVFQRSRVGRGEGAASFENPAAAGGAPPVGDREPGNLTVPGGDRKMRNTPPSEGRVTVSLVGAWSGDGQVLRR